MREESLLGQLVDSCDLNSPAIRRLIVTGISTRSEEHTSELQSLMRISYAVFCSKKKKQTKGQQDLTQAQRKLMKINISKIKMNDHNNTNHNQTHTQTTHDHLYIEG